MTMDDFKKFKKILLIGKLYMTITQKIHGSNAQIHIYKDENNDLQILAGCRTRYIDPSDDNYGFARFVYANKDALISGLGEGRHYGEWAGPGINSGEGLSDKTLCLFDWRRWQDKELPAGIRTVPLLYTGKISLDAINETMQMLKAQGSLLVPGYMKPEGIVIELDGQLYKNVFDEEEVKWKEKSKGIYQKTELPDVSHLLQPKRLEKLLSRDEKYIREYPESLPRICTDYVKDLEAENQFISDNPDSLKLEKKSLGKEIFYFVKSFINKE